MTEPLTQNDANRDGSPDELELDPEPGATRTRLIAAGVVLALGFVFAGIPAALGFGWFGARLFADKVTIWVLNTSGHDLTVTVDFARPLDARAGTLEMLTTRAGPVTLRAVDGSGATVDDLPFEAGATVLYNAAGSECLGVFDVTDYYSGTPNPQIRIVDRIPQRQRIYEVKAPNLILPRRGPPSEVSGAVHWIEDLSCDALDPSREDELLFFITNRLVQRYERAQAEAAAQQQR